MTASHLYPSIEPRRRGRLAVDDIHELYWEECGRAEGVPVVFLHGGPGAGCSPDHRRFFDPEHYRIVLLDQRGAGRSTPAGCLEANTTQHLIEDLEALRRHLEIERWHVFGGSWGSTLALAYAEAHPERVVSLVLRGIFLGSQAEVEWFLYGMRRVFPEAWEDFVAVIPEGERGELLGAFLSRLTDPDRSVRVPAAKAWARYEGACSTLLPNPRIVASFGAEGHALGLARIEAHYFANELFLPKNALLDGLDGIRAIPTAIVQGRYDMVCPIETAETLHRAWPEAEYEIVPDAGHSALEPGTRRALVAATERMKAFR